MTVPRGRRVSLVALRDGAVLGVAGPFEVETPWWVDVEELSGRFPGVAVLRLLEGHPAPGSTVSGDVTYLVEAIDASTELEQALGALAPWSGTLADDPLRLPWAVEGGPARDLDWAALHVEITGQPLQHRTWNLSSIWSLPTAQGSRWLKCVPPFLGHEASVIRFLHGWPVPTLVAAEGHRMLFEALPGENGYDASAATRATLIDLLVRLQCSTIDRLDELVALGVPDRRLSKVVELGADVVRRRDPDNVSLRQLIESSAARIEAIEACGLPDVLVHGDAHGGNARVGDDVEGGAWFDWGDSRIGSPLLDVAVLERTEARHAEPLLAHWLEAWATAIPGSEPSRAWRLLRPLAALGDAVVYQAFLDNIEDSERLYHEGDVPECLARAAKLFEEEQ